MRVHFHSTHSFAASVFWLKYDLCRRIRQTALPWDSKFFFKIILYICDRSYRMFKFHFAFSHF